MLTVTTAASDLTLLSVAELRAAIGVTTGDQDAKLATIEARVALSIARACRVPQGGAVVPTLRSETLTEVFRRHSREVGRWAPLSQCRSEIVLSRRPVSSITSVVEDGTALDADEYECEGSVGLLRRLDGSDHPMRWWAEKITVVYIAGWDTVPADLKLAASKYVNAIYVAGTRDPSLMAYSIPGVLENVRRWVSSEGEPSIPPEVTEILSAGGYLNYWAN